MNNFRKSDQQARQNKQVSKSCQRNIASSQI